MFRSKLHYSLLLMLAAALLLASCTRPAAQSATQAAPTATILADVLPTAATETEPMSTPTQPPAAAPAPTDPAAFSGDWEGKIVLPNAGLEILVALAPGDAWSGTIDVPAQGAAGIPLHDIRLDGNTIHFEMLSDAQLATFDGQLQNDGSLRGAFKQAGFLGEFQLTRPADETAAPLPYSQQPITFTNGDVTLAGTLTLPEGNGPFPALLLISGSGQQNRDEAIPTVPGYRPFREIADLLTRQGFAVLRYDDRGLGDSTGDPTQATSADFADDAEAGLRALQARSDIDPTHIGLLGHSEGGLIAAMIAARNPDVAFVVSMAGSTLPGYDVIIKQVERLTLAGGGAPEQATEAVNQQTQLLNLAVAQDWPNLQTALEGIAGQQIAAMTEEERTAAGDVDALMQQQIAAQMQIFQSPWYQFFLQYDPAQDWAKITVPVLGLYGGKDTQVDADSNTAALRAALEKAGNSDVTITILPTANHLFQNAQTGSVSEYVTLDPYLMPEFLDALSNWLHQFLPANS